MSTIKRKSRRRRETTIDPVHWALLTDAPLPDDDESGESFLAELEFRTVARDLWNEHRERILSDWVAQQPGTRPSCWWAFDAPRASEAGQARYAGCYFAGDMIDSRRLLAGSGKPLHEELAYTPAYHFGIPAWFGDPMAPPTFETQAAYLARHDLLLPGEGRRVAEPHPQPAHIEDAAP